VTLHQKTIKMAGKKNTLYWKHYTVGIKQLKYVKMAEKNLVKTMKILFMQFCAILEIIFWSNKEATVTYCIATSSHCTLNSAIHKMNGKPQVALFLFNTTILKPDLISGNLT